MKLPRRWPDWKRFFALLWHEANDDKILDYAGSLAYSGVLALFPFLLFLVALAGLVINPETVDGLVEQVREVAPSQVADLLTERMRALTGSRPALLTVSAIGAVWAASGGVSALISALDAVYDVEETRPVWKTWGLAVLVTIGAAVLAIAASLIALVTPAVAHLLGDPLGKLLVWLRWPAAAVIMILVVALLYRVLPNMKSRFRLISPGSVIAVVLWLLASAGFSLYVAHFGSYEVVYGALGSVIVLLLWIWISSLAILLGAEVNSVLEKLGVKA